MYMKDIVTSAVAALFIIFTVCLIGFYSVPFAKAESNEVLYEENAFRSVVITDLDILNKANIGFKRTISAVLNGYQGSDEDLIQSLQDTFLEKSGTNEEASDVLFDISPSEYLAAWSPENLLDPVSEHGLIPIAVFNRIDLAPKSFEDCGEFRIVYSLKRPLSDGARYFLIFEAVPANPETSPHEKKMFCQAVAQFWIDLPELDVETAGTKLERFFYEGIISDTKKFGTPVIHPYNLGHIHGQIRGNFRAKIEAAPNELKTLWQMREWRLKINVDADVPTLEFASVPLENAPKIELYEDLTNGSIPLQNLKSKFREYFELQLASNLIAPNPNVQNMDARWIINNLGGASQSDDSGPQIDGRLFDEFQNMLSGNTTRDRIRFGSNGTDGIVGEFLALSKSVLDNSTSVCLEGANCQTISPRELLNRSHILSCGGCHQPFDNRLGKIGGEEINWPNGHDFTHVSEPDVLPRLSNALRDFFLPFRKANLENFVLDMSNISNVGSNLAGERDKITKQFEDVLAQKSNTRVYVIQNFFKPMVEEFRAESEEEAGAFVRYRRAH